MHIRVLSCQMQRVYCAVLAESLNIIHVKFSLQRPLMAQEFGRPAVTAVAVPSPASPCDICGGQSYTGTGFPLSTYGVACPHHSTKVPYSSSPTCCSNQNDKWAKPRNLSKTKALSAIGEHWMGKYSNFFSFQRPSHGWYGWSAASPLGYPGFDPRLAHVILGSDKVTLGQVFLWELRLSPDSIILPMLHTHLTSAGCAYRKDKQVKPGKLPGRTG